MNYCIYTRSCNHAVSMTHLVSCLHMPNKPQAALHTLTVNKHSWLGVGLQWMEFSSPLFLCVVSWLAVGFYWWISIYIRTKMSTYTMYKYYADSDDLVWCL